LMALAPRGRFVAAIMAISVASRFAAPVDRLRLNGLMEWPTEIVTTTVIGVWAPGIVMLFIAAWQARLRWRAGTLWRPMARRSRG
jgi:hypothetical protein